MSNDTAMIRLVREAIFHELDSHEWDFSLDEDRVDFADRVTAWIPRAAIAKATGGA